MRPPLREVIYKSTWYREYYLWVCQIGIQAALLVYNGCDGPDEDVLDKEEGMYNLAALTRAPSPNYYIVNELTLKPWVGSNGYLGGIQLVEEIFKDEGLNLDEIISITTRVDSHYSIGEFKDVLANPTPKNFFDAKNSIPWAYALAALGYQSGLEWFTEERYQDPICINLARKVRIESLESGLYNNEVEITTKSNTYKRQICWMDETLGSPRRPMSWDQIDSKFMRLTKPIVGEDQAKKMVSIFHNLENVHDIRELTRYFSPST